MHQKQGQFGETEACNQKSWCCFFCRAKASACIRPHGLISILRHFSLHLVSIMFIARGANVFITPVSIENPGGETSIIPLSVSNVLIGGFRTPLFTTTVVILRRVHQLGADAISSFASAQDPALRWCCADSYYSIETDAWVFPRRFFSGSKAPGNIFLPIHSPIHVSV